MGYWYWLSAWCNTRAAVTASAASGAAAHAAAVLVLLGAVKPHAPALAAAVRNEKETAMQRTQHAPPQCQEAARGRGVNMGSGAHFLACYVCSYRPSRCPVPRVAE